MQMVLVAFGPRASGTSAFAVAPPRIPERCKYQQSESGAPKRVGVQEKLADNQRERRSEAENDPHSATSRDTIVSGSSQTPVDQRPNRAHLARPNRAHLASVHKCLRLCDLCEELWFFCSCAHIALGAVRQAKTDACLVPFCAR
jgi:hypothetical protein